MLKLEIIKLIPSEHIKNSYGVRYKYSLNNQIFYFKHCILCNKLHKVKLPSHNDSSKFCSKKCKNTYLESIKIIQKLKCKKTWSEKTKEEIRNIVKKRENTNTIRYGVKQVMHNNEIKFKNKQNIDKNKISRKTLNYLKKYQDNTGFYNPLQKHVKNFNNLNKEFVSKKFYENGMIPVNKRIEFMEYFGFKTEHMSNFINICLKHGFEYEKSKMRGVSLEEKKLCKCFVNRYPSLKIIENARILKDNKTGCFKEIDIYIPDLNVGIEYNGVFWHDKLKDMWKIDKCNEMGIKLFIYYDDEDLDDFKKIVFEYVDNLINRICIFKN